MRWAVGDHQDGVGFADHAVSDLDEAGLPVRHAGPHRGHSQLSVIGMVQFPDSTDTNTYEGVFNRA